MSRFVPTYDLYGEDRDNSGNFQLHCETIASRSSAYHWEIGLHRHEHFLQFLYICEGSGDAIFETATTPLAPPCVIVIPPGPVHGFRFSRDVVGLVITALASRLPALSMRREPRVVALGAGSADATYLDQTFKRIAKEYDAARSDRANILDAYLAVITALVAQPDETASSEVSADAAQRHVTAFKDLIGRHFRQHLTAAEYAARLGMSPTHLNRLSRKVTGISAHHLIIGRLIEEAMRALSLTGASIHHISESLGFSDPAYFSRCFRLKTGMSPRDYRRAQRSQHASRL